MGPRQRARVLPRRFDVCSVVHKLATFVLLLQVRQGASENDRVVLLPRALNLHLVGAGEHLARPA